MSLWMDAVIGVSLDVAPGKEGLRASDELVVLRLARVGRAAAVRIAEDGDDVQRAVLPDLRVLGVLAGGDALVLGDAGRGARHVSVVDGATGGDRVEVVPEHVPAVLVRSALTVVLGVERLELGGVLREDDVVRARHAAPLRPCDRELRRVLDALEVALDRLDDGAGLDAADLPVRGVLGGERADRVEELAHDRLARLVALPCEHLALEREVDDLRVVAGDRIFTVGAVIHGPAATARERGRGEESEAAEQEGLGAHGGSLAVQGWKRLSSSPKTTTRCSWGISFRRSLKLFGAVSLLIDARTRDIDMFVRLFV